MEQCTISIFDPGKEESSKDIMREKKQGIRAFTHASLYNMLPGALIARYL